MDGVYTLACNQCEWAARHGFLAILSGVGRNW
jgi:hypothetical protein